MNRILFSALFFLLSIANGLAQEYTQEIRTIDGSIFRGEILEVREDTTIILSRSLGELRIETEMIKSVRTINLKRLTPDSLWQLHPSQTNHFVGGTAYNVEKNESYYQNSWIFVNQFVYGVTDHFSIGAGFFPGTLLGAGVFPFWVTPKISIPIVKDKLNVAVGSFVGYAHNEGIAALPYGNITLGKRDKNVTFAIGGVYDSYWESKPFFSLSTLIRTSNKGYFISENYYLDGEMVITIGGRRMLGRTSIDYGVLIPAWETDALLGLPWLGIRTPLNKEKLE